MSKLEKRAVKAGLTILVIAILGVIIDGSHTGGQYQAKYVEIQRRLEVLETTPAPIPHRHWWKRGEDGRS